jgi:hypothetical protein
MIVTDGTLVWQRATRTAILAVTVVSVTGCGQEHPVAPADVGATASSQFSALAFTATVTPRTNAVSIAPPTFAGAAASPRSAADAPHLSLSLLGSDVVRLVPSNLRMSALGASTPGKIRVSFDVSLENRLPSLALIAPTWPVPPVASVLMFPLDYTVTSAPGGVAGGDGNAIGVGLPGGGRVMPSGDWNGTGDAGSGAPYAFFSSVACPSSVTIDCFRWVSFGARVEPTGTRAIRTVGFDIDPSVAQFRARMIVVADLSPAAATPP